MKLEFFKVEPEEDDLGGARDSVITHVQGTNDINLDYLLSMIKRSRSFVIDGQVFVSIKAIDETYKEIMRGTDRGQR